MNQFYKEPHFISVKNVSRVFKSGREKVYALNNVNLNLEEGMFTILKGRSGSGKTTLINLLGALDYPTNGDIFLENRNITQLSDIERDYLRKELMGFVFQSVALVSNMTAYENIEFTLRIATKMKAKERKKRVEECLNLVGLKNKIKMFPHQMSGGEQQRVGIARAIAHYPKILYADEPTAELDTHTSLQVVKVFKDLIKNQHITVVMTTHDQKMMELADQVITLKDGEVINE